MLSTLQRLLETDEGRAVLTTSLDGLLSWRPAVPAAARDRVPPYPELGRAVRASDGRSYEPIFITARFRTGSTLLWNLFRHVDGVTAYYEPFNERRWFEPGARSRQVDPTHRHVDDYWREYADLGELRAWYREEWTVRQLWMDADSWAPDMKRFLDVLIERAPHRPVLQFNHIDFRLAWIRSQFPCAKLVHLYRHPRDQWCSSLLDPAAFGRRDHTAQFAQHDLFYLLQWSRDLKYHFPFLDEASVEHPYQLFYYIWKLSYLCGVAYADYSLSFEALIANPTGEMEQLLHRLGLTGTDSQRLAHLVDPPPVGKWRAYAGEDWFRSLESECEDVLAAFLTGCDGSVRTARWAR